MGRGFHQTIAMGNLGKDPETRSGGQTPVARFSLACGESFKDRDGQKQERCEWYRVVCFGRTAENVGQFCKKGSEVLVTGRMQTRQYEAQDGSQKSTTELVASNVQFLSSPKSEQRPSAPPAREEYEPGSDTEDFPF